jgi:glycerol-3-phosphate dehydrogenase
VLLRRTRLGLLAGRDVAAAGDAARRVADALAAELCWDEAEVAAQLAAWAAEARAEGVVGSA